MVAGTAVNVVGLDLLAVAGTPALFFIAFMLVQASNNLAEGAGVIPDVISDGRRGQASGFLGVIEQLRSVVGLAAVIGRVRLLGQTRMALILSYGFLAGGLRHRGCGIRPWDINGRANQGCEMSKVWIASVLASASGFGWTYVWKMRGRV